jgi:acyl carrier protein
MIALRNRRLEVTFWGIFTLLDRTNPGSAERVGRLVRELLAKRSIARAVSNDDSLTECGLSSLDIVNLMLGVEAEFAIKIPDREMTPSNFRSIAQIDRLVCALLGDN